MVFFQIKLQLIYVYIQIENLIYFLFKDIPDSFLFTIKKIEHSVKNNHRSMGG